MKKISALGLSTAAYLSLAIPAFAATTPIQINPCTGTSTFSGLCGLAGGNLGTLINSIIIILFVAAVILALAFLIWGGIKWIVSGGDKAKVEGARNTIVAALVGLVLVFLVYLILNVLFQFFGLGTINQLLNIPALGL